MDSLRPAFAGDWQTRTLGRSVSEVDIKKIKAERERRLDLWRKLRQFSAPDQVEPSFFKKLRLHRGQQGVFRDQDLTGPLTSTGKGIVILRQGNIA
mgnify:CR=1 FL=1